MKGSRYKLGGARDRRHLDNNERPGKKEAILTALAEATGDSPSMDEMATNTDDITSEYYTLTSEEVKALVDGDVQKIKDWVSSLDRRHAIRLLCWLIREDW